MGNAEGTYCEWSD